ARNCLMFRFLMPVILSPFLEKDKYAAAARDQSYRARLGQTRYCSFQRSLFSFTVSFRIYLFDRMAVADLSKSNLAGNGATIGSKILCAAQRQSEDCVSGVGGAAGRKDAGARHIEIRNLMGLSVIVDHGIASAGAHNRAAHEMDGGHRGTHLPDLLGAGGMADFHAL